MSSLEKILEDYSPSSKIKSQIDQTTYKTNSILVKDNLSYRLFLNLSNYNVQDIQNLVMSFRKTYTISKIVGLIIDDDFSRANKKKEELEIIHKKKFKDIQLEIYIWPDQNWETAEPPTN